MFWIVIMCIALFFGLLGGLELGRYIGRRTKEEGTPAADSVVLAVLGLLIAFTFTTSASRFDERRQLIVRQANALGTAHLRLDVLAPEDRPAIREHMLRWVDLFLTIPKLPKDNARQAAIADAGREQNEAWKLALSSVERRQAPPLIDFVMSPFNEWMDLSTTRLAMEHMGPPPVVMPTLIILSLVSAVIAGFNMSHFAKRSVVHMLAFSTVVAFSIYVIFDLSEPRIGLININALDHTMVQVGQSIKEAAAAQTAQTRPSRAP